VAQEAEVSPCRREAVSPQPGSKESAGVSVPVRSFSPELLQMSEGLGGVGWRSGSSAGIPPGPGSFQQNAEVGIRPGVFVGLVGSVDSPDPTPAAPDQSSVGSTTGACVGHIRREASPESVQRAEGNDLLAASVAWADSSPAALQGRQAQSATSQFERTGRPVGGPGGPRNLRRVTFRATGA
jgi:hypothetical protein